MRHTISNQFNASSRWVIRWWYPEGMAYILLFGILANCDILNATPRYIQKDRIDKINIFQVKTYEVLICIYIYFGSTATEHEILSKYYFIHLGY